jgi:DNA-3-methyladenine glycosylase
LYFVRRAGPAILAGRIVEVEAYLGADDPASHAYRGRTPRNDGMFLKGGHLYVYFTYGMHFCGNVVTGPAGTPHAVLLRALEPADGVAVLAHNRQMPVQNLEALCSGPAKLCQAFGIARGQNGANLCGNEIWIERRDAPLLDDMIGSSSRVGISRAKEHQWRFFVKGSRFVSGKPDRQ